MPKAADDPRTFIAQVRLVGRTDGAVKALPSFRKGRHTVPDAVTPATQAFFTRLCADVLAEEAEGFFQRARAALAYKRKDLALEVSAPGAVLTAKDFTFEMGYALSETDPASYEVTRILHTVQRPGLAAEPAFDGLFAGLFDAIEFALTKGARVEAVIDAVEELDGEGGLRVDYPSDCRACTLTVEGVPAAVEFDGASLRMVFPRAGSPRELIEAFGAVRRAFALTKVRVLAGLL